MEVVIDRSPIAGSDFFVGAPKQEIHSLIQFFCDRPFRSEEQLPRIRFPLGLIASIATPVARMVVPSGTPR